MVRTLFKRNVKITRIKKDYIEDLQDTVLIENPIDILINSKPIANIICLNKDLKELAVGFLFSIGIINSFDDIEEINTNNLENEINAILKESINFEDFEMNPVSRVVDTTCGISSPWRDLIKNRLDESKVKEKLWSKNNIKLQSKTIFAAIKEMQMATPLYKETGGCHGAAIFDTQ